MDYVLLYLVFVYLIYFASCGLLRSPALRGSLVIPEEVPSLLQVAYSNIPQLKKGTDSRIGFGYAFGNHADFQVLLELGPQTVTKSLDGQRFPASKSSNRKRRTSSRSETTSTSKDKHQPEPSRYLQAWAQKMRDSHKNTVEKSGVKMETNDKRDDVEESTTSDQQIN